MPNQTSATTAIAAPPELTTAVLEDLAGYPAWVGSPPARRPGRPEEAG